MSYDAASHGERERFVAMVSGPVDGVHQRRPAVGPGRVPAVAC
jgi:hypothetical protein